METTSLRRRSRQGLQDSHQPGVAKELKSSTVVLSSPDKKSTFENRVFISILATITLLLSFLLLTRPWWPSQLHLSPAFKERLFPPFTTLNNACLNLPLDPSNHNERGPKIFEFNWSITADYRRPDGVKKRIFLINNEFPGPTIEVRGGDTIRLQVENKLDEGEELGLHFHGLHMRNANDMDGAVGLTQCGIRPNQSFIYQFDISHEQHGTFWYHAHDQVQRADGLYGAFVIHQTNNSTRTTSIKSYRHYDEELILLIGDWYHRSAEEVLKWYMRAGSFGNEPVPDSIVINGLGRFSCSDAVPARPVDCIESKLQQRPYLQLNRDKKYRFRVINTGTLAGFSLDLPDAHLTLIEVDGGHSVVSDGPVQSIGILYPGERMDLIVEFHRSDSNTASFLGLRLDDENFKYPNPSLSLDHLFPIAFDTAFEAPVKILGANSENLVSLDSIAQSKSSHAADFPQEADVTFVIYTTTLKLSRLSNVPHGFMNLTSWKPQQDPPLPLILIPRPKWDNNQLVPHIPVTSEGPLWVDIVINNLDDGSHPFHLHGYDFYVLSIHPGGSSYWGSFNPFDSPDGPPGGPFNLINPIKKDTVFVPRRGYTVIRFRADNEGIWMFHCHILWHQASGMSMGFQVGADNYSNQEPHSFWNLSNVEQIRSTCRY